MSQEPKHISKLDAAGKARMQQCIQEALLAIVAAQGKPITFHLSAIDAISRTYRLKIEIEGELLILTPEEFRPEIIRPTHEIITSSRN